MPCGCFGKKDNKKKGLVGTDEEKYRLRDSKEKEAPVIVQAAATTTTAAPSKTPPATPPQSVGPPPAGGDVRLRPEDDPDKANRRRDVVASFYSDQCELTGFKMTGSRPPSAHVGGGQDGPAATSSPAASSPGSTRSAASCRADLAEKRREFFKDLTLEDDDSMHLGSRPTSRLTDPGSQQTPRHSSHYHEHLSLPRPSKPSSRNLKSTPNSQQETPRNGHDKSLEIPSQALLKPVNRTPVENRQSADPGDSHLHNRNLLLADVRQRPVLKPASEHSMVKKFKNMREPKSEVSENHVNDDFPPENSEVITTVITSECTTSTKVLTDVPHTEITTQSTQLISDISPTDSSKFDIDVSPTETTKLLTDTDTTECSVIQVESPRNNSKFFDETPESPMMLVDMPPTESTRLLIETSSSESPQPIADISDPEISELLVGLSEPEISQLLVDLATPERVELVDNKQPPQFDRQTQNANIEFSSGGQNVVINETSSQQTEVFNVENFPETEDEKRREDTHFSVNGPNQDIIHPPESDFVFVTSDDVSQYTDQPVPDLSTTHDKPFAEQIQGEEDKYILDVSQPKSQPLLDPTGDDKFILDQFQPEDNFILNVNQQELVIDQQPPHHGDQQHPHVDHLSQALFFTDQTREKDQQPILDLDLNVNYSQQPKGEPILDLSKPIQECEPVSVDVTSVNIGQSTTITTTTTTITTHEPLPPSMDPSFLTAVEEPEEEFLQKSATLPEYKVAMEVSSGHSSDDDQTAIGIVESLPEPPCTPPSPSQPETHPLPPLLKQQPQLQLISREEEENVASVPVAVVIPADEDEPLPPAPPTPPADFGLLPPAPPTPPAEIEDLPPAPPTPPEEDEEPLPPAPPTPPTLQKTEEVSRTVDPAAKEVLVTVTASDDAPATDEKRIDENLTERSSATS